MNLAATDNPMVRVEYTWKPELIERPVVPTVDVHVMIKQLYEMSNDLEEMVRSLKAVSEVCDCDSYLYYAYEDIDKLHSRMLSVMDQLRMEAV